MSRLSLSKKQLLHEKRNSKIALDNDLKDIRKFLKEDGLHSVLVIPSFEDLLTCKERKPSNIYLAKHRWLNRNGIKIFVTSNYDTFFDFSKRNYFIFGIKKQLLAKRKKIARKILNFIIQDFDPKRYEQDFRIFY